MPTQFPIALDDFLNPTSASTLGTPGLKHSEQHANTNDAIEAIQLRVGVVGSADTSSLTKQVDDLRLAASTFLDQTQVTQIVASTAGDGTTDLVTAYLTVTNT